MKLHIVPVIIGRLGIRGSVNPHQEIWWITLSLIWRTRENSIDHVCRGHQTEVTTRLEAVFLTIVRPADPSWRHFEIEKSEEKKKRERKKRESKNKTKRKTIIQRTNDYGPWCGIWVCKGCCSHHRDVGTNDLVGLRSPWGSAMGRDKSIRERWEEVIYMKWDEIIL